MPSPAPTKDRQLAPCLLAFALALLSNYFFTGAFFSRATDTSSLWGPPQVGGLIALAAAIGVACWAFGRADDFPRLPPVPRSDAGLGATSVLGSNALWQFLPCAALYFGTLALYWAGGESHAVHLLWGLSIVALILPLIRHFDLQDFWPIPFWEYALLIIIVGIAFTLRNVDLVQVPYHIDNDISIMGLFSKSLIANHDIRWIGMAPTNHQFSEHQMQALSMRFFGANHYGLVVLSVLAGTATVPALYLTGRMLFNRWVGFLAAAGLASNYAHFHFSRIVFGSIPTFFLVLTGLFLLHGIRRGKSLSFALAGIFMGVGILGYYSGRVIPVIAGVVFVMWWLQRKKMTPIPVSYWLLTLAGCIVVFGPNLVYTLQKSDEFVGRGNDVAIWNDLAWNHLSNKYQSGGHAFTVIVEQIKRTFLTPFYFPDESVICYLRRPMLGVFAVLSFTLGLGYCLRRYREIPTAFGLVWIGLTFVLGGVLTLDPPYWPHLNIATPALALVAGIGAERFGRRLILSRLPWRGILVPTAMVSALLASGLQNWDVYYRFASVNASGPAHAVRQIERLPGDYRVFIVSHELQWTQETFRFLTPNVDGRNLTEEELFNRTPQIDKPTVFFIFEDADPKCVNFLADAFPWSSRRLYRDTWNWPVFTMIRVLPPHFVESPQAFEKSDQMLWNTRGGFGLGIMALGAVFVGCVLLNRELSTRKEAVRERPPAGERPPLPENFVLFSEPVISIAPVPTER